MSFLIADSGGTKTDWCIVHSNGEKQFFTTESYHPLNWNDEFFQRAQSFWKKYPIEELELHFFGAGCYTNKYAKELSSFFQRIGFKKTKILSDLHGAAYATLGSRNGEVAILGTGSVAFSWNNETVTNLKGGKGFLLGDQGSAYYFGKLVLTAWTDGKLNSFQRKHLEELVSPSNISLKDRFKVADIAQKLGGLNEEFESYHIDNLRAFVVTDLLSFENDTLHVVGSYGYHNRELLGRILDSIDIKLEVIIEKPITHLVEQNGLFIE